MRRRWWKRGFIVGTAAEGFVVRPLRDAASNELLPAVAVVIRISGIAIPGSELQSEGAPGLMIHKTNRIQSRLNRRSGVLPQGCRWCGCIVETDPQLLSAGCEHRHPASIDLIVLKRRHARVPVHTNRRLASTVAHC